MIRSAYCLGANGVVIPTDRSASVTPGHEGASAGSARHLPVARVTNLSRTIDDLKNRGFLDLRGGCPRGNLREQDFGTPVGSVLKGIQRIAAADPEEMRFFYFHSDGGEF